MSDHQKTERSKERGVKENELTLRGPEGSTMILDFLEVDCSLERVRADTLIAARSGDSNRG